MPLADRIADTPARITGKPCSVGELLQRLDPEETKALNQMLYELGWSQARVFAALQAEGHVVGQQTINRHRSRACRCFQGQA